MLNLKIVNVPIVVTDETRRVLAQSLGEDRKSLSDKEIKDHVIQLFIENFEEWRNHGRQ